MQPMTTLALSGTVPACDAHIVFIRPAAKGSVEILGDHKLKRPVTIVEALLAVGAKAKNGEVTLVPAGRSSDAPVVIAVGLGTSTELDDLRAGVGNAVRGLVGKKKAVVALPSTDDATLRAVAEGALMAAYTFDGYRTVKSQMCPPVKALVLLADVTDAAIKASAARAQATANAVNGARDLANTPANDLYPETFVGLARGLVAKLPVTVEVLDEVQLAEQGYGGIIGVGKGSQRPPRLLRLEYRPAGATAHIAFVGKGITFDTGGISLKPALGQFEMKTDMSGAAAVIQATAAIARLGLKVNVTTYAALAENMPGSLAQRPGDVLTTYSGKTVEVLNTDAEGRLVLCDALTRVQQDYPDVIIDVATLTGACAIAVGPSMSAILCNDSTLTADLMAAATAGGEHLWPLPLTPLYKHMLDSKIADLQNVKEMAPPAKGGTIVAGLFLQEFINKGQKWAHLDIAPVAFNNGGAFGYTPTGSTGSTVRTLLEYAHRVA